MFKVSSPTVLSKMEAFRDASRAGEGSKSFHCADVGSWTSRVSGRGDKIEPQFLIEKWTRYIIVPSKALLSWSSCFLGRRNAADAIREEVCAKRSSGEAEEAFKSTTSSPNGEKAESNWGIWYWKRIDSFLLLFFSSILLPIVIWFCVQFICDVFFFVVFLLLLSSFLLFFFSSFLLLFFSSSLPLCFLLWSDFVFISSVT